MPGAALGAVLTGAVSVGVVAATSGLAAVTLATFAIPAAISLGVGLLVRAFAPKPPSIPGINPGSAGAGRGAAENTLNDAITPARWVVGQVRCGGKVVWVHVDDDEDIINADTKRDTVSSLHMAMVLSQNECDSIQEIWLDGEKLDVTKSSSGGHSVYTADGFVCHEYFKNDGTEGAECFAAATGADLSFNASDVSAMGLSWVYLKFTQNDYGNDLDSRRYSRIPRIEFVVRGIKIRSGRNPSGSSAKNWTENAAIVRKWWLTERRGIAWGRINKTFYNAARTRCDTLIDISNLTNFDSSAMSTDLKRYTINGLIHSGDDVTRIEQDMDFAWDGSIVDWDGELLFRPGGTRTAVKEITGDDVVEEPIYRPGTSLNANRYICDIPQSEWHDYLPYTLTVDDTGKQDYDGQILSLNLGSTELVSNPAQAANLLRSAARRARASSNIEIIIAPGDDFENTTIVPGDRVTASFPELGINDQDFFVLDSRVLPGWATKLTLTEWGSDWYDDSVSLEHYSPRQILGVGDLSAPSPVTVTIAALQNDDGAFSWYALITMPSAVWEYQIRYKLSSADDTQFQESITAANQTTVILNAAGEWTFEVRARSRDGRLSPPTTVTATADYNVVLPTDPVLARKTIEGGYFRWVFNNLGKFTNGLEIAYTFADIGDTAPALITSAAEFEAATLLDAYPIVPCKSLTEERTIVSQIPGIGQYNLYVRARDIAGRYSGIVRLGLETLKLDAPGNVNVDELGDGTRSYSWTLVGSEHIAGVVIRYKKAGDHIPEPGPIENAPPTIIAANTNEDGDVILAYSEPLDDTNHPATSAFSVAVDGTAVTPDSVAISKNTVLLTLTVAVTVGQSVAVTYTVPATNPLQDTHGDPAGALTDEPVNNTLRDSQHQPVWSSMDVLNDGYLTSSPYQTKQPGAGIWDFAFRTMARNGILSAGISYVQKALNEPVQLDIAEAVKQAIGDNPSLITLTTEVEQAEAARDRAIKAAVEGEAFKDAAETAKDASETAQAAAEQAETNVDTALKSTESARDEAETAADNAETEAMKAANSESAASGSASAAAGSATTSQNSATASGRSATSAASQASAAAASATAAGRSATAASGSASTASTKATEAGTEAAAAKTERVKAEAAKDDAESAQASAESAETSAVSAKNDAESAESAATTQATNAAKSETAAGRSATAAATSASTAASEASDAESSATAAETAQTKAETAQSKAETAESNASSSATDADGSATSAASSLSSVKASATAAGNAKDAAETAESNAETAEGNAKASASAAASSAQTAASEASDAGDSATAAQSAQTAAETAQGKAETAETNASSSATDASGSATAAAASESAVAASASSAKGSADAAAVSAQTATTKASEASTSATAAETAKTAAETAQSNAGTAETNAATSATNADGSATAAATSASAAAASATQAAGAGDSATAASASAATASAKATEAATSAAAAEVSKTSAETAATNASVSETNAAASDTSAKGASALATTEREAAAGFAGQARQAVAGIEQTVSAQIDSDLRTTFASIVGLRAIAGEAKAKLEIVALSDPSGSRAAGVMTGDFQSFDYAPAGGTISGARARGVTNGLTFESRLVRDDDNGFTVSIFKRRRSGSRNRTITVTENTGSDFINVFLNDDVGGDTITFNRADIVNAVNNNSTIMRASGTGNIEIDFTDATTSGARIGQVNLSGGRDSVVSKNGKGWILRRDGTMEVDAASIRGTLSAKNIDSNVLNWTKLFEADSIADDRAGRNTGVKGVLVAGTTSVTLNISGNIDNYETIHFLTFGNSANGNYFSISQMPVGEIPTAYGSGRLQRGISGSGEDAGLDEILIRRNSAGTTLYARGEDRLDEMFISQIWGVNGPAV